MMPSTLSSIALFGTRQSIWPAAALLAQNLPPSVTLTIVEDVNDDVPPAALTMKVASRFHDQLGIDARTLVEQCGGRMGLGHDLVDWRGEGSRHFIAASGTLPKINGVPLHHIMLRAAMMNNEPEKLAYLFQPFRLAARTAMEGKFSLASDDPSSPLTMLGPMVQIDADGYAAFLDSRISGDAVTRRKGRPVRVTHGADEDDIHMVTLDGGQEITADLFVDTDGALSELVSGAFAPLEMPSILSPFDRIGTARVPSREGCHVRGPRIGWLRGD